MDDSGARPEPRVLVLGPVAIVGADGAPSDVTGHAGRILVELAGRGPHVSRDRLLAALWPDEPPKSADAALRVHLSRLRKLLEPAGASLARRADGHELVGAVTDLAVVDEHLERARQLRSQAVTTTELATCAQLVDDALARWRGDAFSPYAADASDVELQALAGQVGRRREELDDLAVELALDLGRHTELLPRLERAVVERPFDERCWGRLAVAHYRSGRQREALATIDRARRVLLDELGVEPGADLRGLQHAILVHDPALQWRSPRDRRAGDAAGATGRAGGGPGDALLGREEEILHVLGALEEAAVVTVTGPPGMGKSRVVAAAGTVWAGDRPTFVLDAETVPDAALLGFSLADAVGVHLDPGADVDLLDVVAGTLAASAALLVIDGGEHLDPAVPALVADLLAREDDLHVLVGHRSPLGLAGERVVPLALLPAAQALALLRDRLPAGDRPPADALGRVAAAVEGHPLSLELVAGWVELLGIDAVATQLEAGVLPLASEGARSLVERVEISLGLVDDAARDGFACLGVFQGDFDAAALAAVAGTSTRAAATILRDLTRASLVHPGARPGSWRLLAGVRDAARTLAERTGRQDAARAAHLEWLRAQLAPYGPEAYGLDVAGVLAAVGPWQPDVRATFERAVDAGDLSVAGELYRSMFWFWWAAGQEQEAIRAGERLRPLCDADPRHPFAAMVLAGHCLVGGTFAWQAQHLADAETALAWAEAGTDPFATFAARSAVALGAGWSGDLDRAEEVVAQMRAEPMARDEFPFQSVLPLEYQGLVRIAQGRFAEARAAFEQVREDYEAIGSPIGEAKAFRFLGWIAGFEGDTERAEACHRVNAARSEAAGDEHGVLHARIGLAGIHADAGRWAEAQVGYGELVPPLLARGDLGCAAECLCGLAEVQLARATIDRAGEGGDASGEAAGPERLFADAASLASRATDRGILLRAVLGLAEVALAAGRPAVAARLLGGLDAVPITGGRPPRVMDPPRLDALRVALADRFDPATLDELAADGARTGLRGLVAGIRSDLVLRDAGGLAEVTSLAPPRPEGAPGERPPRPPGASRRRAG